MSRWAATLVTPSPLDVTAAISGSATLALTDEGEGHGRLVGLLIAGASYAGETPDGLVYEIELTERAALLRRRGGYRVFVDKTTREIVQEVLRKGGLSGADVAWRLAGSYSPRSMCVQYQETDWAFVERLLADEGISYWFEGRDDARVLVLGDDANAHDGIEGNTKIPFSDESGLVAARRFSSFAVTHRLVTTAVHVRDFDVRAPKVPIEGKAGSGARQYFEYPSSTVDAAASSRRAGVRLEQLARRKIVARGVSDCVRVEPGRVLELIGASDDAMNARWLVVSVEHDVELGAPQAGAGQRPYKNRVELVPAAAVHRPDRPRAAPRVPGVESAITTGPAGEEIHVDDLARVKIRFPWDRAHVTDDRSSCWVRILQMGLGGSMVLPRVGWEVPVMYIDGNPDRPIVLGRLYNATAVHPYGLPGGHATSSFQSASTPGGGSTNEIRMGDSGGSMELFVHASKDQTVAVGGSAEATIGANELHDVGLTLKVGVHGSQTLTVGAKQSVNVGNDFAVEVKGGRTELVGGLESNKVTGNRYVIVKGGYTELVGAANVIQANQVNYGVKGAFTQLVGGAMNLACALGASESVAAARTELVSGGKKYVVSTGMGDSVIGAHTITAGPTKEKADGGVSTDVKGAASIKVGGGVKISAGGVALLKAPDITFNVAGSIKLKNVKVGGGKMKNPSKTTLKGDVKRKGGTEVDG